MASQLFKDLMEGLAEVAELEGKPELAKTIRYERDTFDESLTEAEDLSEGLEEDFYEMPSEEDEPVYNCPDCGDELTFVGYQGNTIEYKCPVCGKYFYDDNGDLLSADEYDDKYYEAEDESLTEGVQGHNILDIINNSDIVLVDDVKNDLSDFSLTKDDDLIDDEQPISNIDTTKKYFISKDDLGKILNRIANEDIIITNRAKNSSFAKDNDLTPKDLRSILRQLSEGDYSYSTNSYNPYFLGNVLTVFITDKDFILDNKTIGGLTIYIKIDVSDDDYITFISLHKGKPVNNPYRNESLKEAFEYMLDPGFEDFLVSKGIDPDDTDDMPDEELNALGAEFYASKNSSSKPSFYDYMSDQFGDDDRWEENPDVADYYRKEYERQYGESLDEAKNETLNQAIWDENNELKPEVKETLTKIADTFLSKLAEDDIPLDVEDIEIVGSNANYNYTPQSDIDLHIIADLSQFKGREKELAEKIYQCKKSLFNDKYDPTIRGFEVEIYVEPAEDKNDNDIPDEVEEPSDIEG